MINTKIVVRKNIEDSLKKNLWQSWGRQMYGCSQSLPRKNLTLINMRLKHLYLFLYRLTYKVNKSITSIIVLLSHL